MYRLVKGAYSTDIIGMVFSKYEAMGGIVRVHIDDIIGSYSSELEQVGYLDVLKNSESYNYYGIGENVIEIKDLKVTLGQVKDLINCFRGSLNLSNVDFTALGNITYKCVEYGISTADILDFAEMVTSIYDFSCYGVSLGCLVVTESILKDTDSVLSGLWVNSLKAQDIGTLYDRKGNNDGK